MTDWLTPRQRSFNMGSIRSVGNKTTEQAFAKLLRSARISGWRRHLPLPGRPDFVFPSCKLAVFVDGCFWHGCRQCYRRPQDNRNYWKSKLERNRTRDRKVTRLLHGLGWKVLRVWEHSLDKPTLQDQVLSRLKDALRCARPVPLRLRGQKAGR